MDKSRIAIGTHVFLRIEHEWIDPSEVTDLLGVSPTIFASEPNPGTVRTGPHGKVWVLSSAWAVNSQDNIEHFKWLVHTIGPCGPKLRILRERGFEIKIYCSWIGRKGGYGGPRLTPEITTSLGELGVEVYFDVNLLDLDKPRQTTQR